MRVYKLFALTRIIENMKPYPHADPVIFTGRCSGKIVEPQEGQGFGWDTIFVPDGETEPFSKMSTEKVCSDVSASLATF